MFASAELCMYLRAMFTPSSSPLQAAAGRLQLPAQRAQLPALLLQYERVPLRDAHRLHPRQQRSEGDAVEDHRGPGQCTVLGWVGVGVGVRWALGEGWSECMSCGCECQWVGWVLDGLST